MNDKTEEKSIHTAFERSASSHDLVKILQEQVECLDQIQNTPNANYTWYEEINSEKPSSDSFYTDSDFYLDSVDEINSSVLTPISKKVDKIKDDAVITTLLPTLEGVKKKRDAQNHHRMSSLRSLKFNSQQTANGLLNKQLIKDMLNTQTLNVEESKVDTENSRNKNTYERHCTLTESKNCENVSKLLASLTQTDIFKRGKRIKHTCEEKLKSKQVFENELQNANELENKLAGEIEKMQSKKASSEQNVSDAGQQKSSGEGPRVHESIESNTKCFSDGPSTIKNKYSLIDDTLSSLQDQNLKMKRKQKAKEDEARRKILAEKEKRAKPLSAGVDLIISQLSSFEQKISDQSSTSELDQKKSDSSTTPTVENQTSSPDKPTKRSDVEVQVEEKIKRLEDELHHAIKSMEENKELQVRIKELHESLLEKDDQIKSYETDLNAAIKKNEELIEKYEALQKNDIFKRKEVMQLCEKFENMKGRYNELEDELCHLRTRDRKDCSKEWAVQASLHRLYSENENLQKKLVSDQMEMSVNKQDLEKDYNLLKQRYDNLLVKLNGLSGADLERTPFNHRGGSDFEEKSQVKLDATLECPPPLVALYETPDTDLLYEEDPMEENPSLEPLTGVRSTPALADINKCRRLKPPSNVQKLKLLYSSSAGVRPGVTTRKFSPSSSELRTRSDHDILSRKVPNAAAGASPVRPVALGGIKKTVGMRSPLAASRGKVSISKTKLTSPQCSGCSGPNSPLSGKTNDMRKTVAVCEKVNVKKDSGKRANSSNKSSDLTELNIHRRIRNLLHNDSQCPTSSPNPHLSKNPNQSLVQRRTRAVSLNSKLRNPQWRAVCASPDFIAKSQPCKFTTNDGHPYGESAYAKEYLSNMNGVKLLVDLSHNSSGLDVRQLQAKGILQNATMSSLGSDISSNDAMEIQSNLSGLSGNSQRFVSVASLLKNNSVSPNRSISDRSLRLSDLPCDRSRACDKFRNFDDYVRPPALIKSGGDLSSLLEQRELRYCQAQLNTMKDNNLSFLSDNEENQHGCLEWEMPDDLLEQSSASTTRDHAGRVEFLRKMQINAGVRMPALMRDVTMRDDVIVNESDLDGEIKLDLGQYQTAYAEQLVKKYTKNA